MLKFLKELFLGTPTESVVSAPYKVPEPVATTPIPLVVEEVQPVTEVTADPVSVALDLEPMDFATATTPITAKKPRKPRAPKTAEAKPAKKVTTKNAPAIKATKVKKAK